MTDEPKFLGKDLSIMQRIKGNFKAINQFCKIFNGLCPTCRAKCIRDPRTNLEDYCDPCSEKAKRRLNKIKEMIK